MMAEAKQLDIESLQRLVELLPPGRAKGKYTGMLAVLARPPGELALSQAEVVLLKTQLVGSPDSDWKTLQQIQALEETIKEIKKAISKERGQEWE